MSLSALFLFFTYHLNPTLFLESSVTLSSFCDGSPPTGLPLHFCRPSLAWLSLAHPHYSSALKRAQVISRGQSLSQAAQHLAVSGHEKSGCWSHHKPWCSVLGGLCLGEAGPSTMLMALAIEPGPPSSEWRGVTVLFVGVTQSKWTQLHLRTLLEGLLTWTPFSMALRIRGKGKRLIHCHQHGSIYASTLPVTMAGARSVDYLTAFLQGPDEVSTYTISVHSWGNTGSERVNNFSSVQVSSTVWFEPNCIWVQSLGLV